MNREFEYKITLGIFGGSFDPPHVGHIRLCEEFSKRISSRILIMPAKISPFKIEKNRSVSDFERIQMCKIAFSHISNAEVCDYELNKNEVSYTYKTVEHFLNKNPDEKICICVGADCLESLEYWSNSNYLFKNCIFAAAYRYEDKSESLDKSIDYLRKKYNAKIIPLLYSPVEVSSTHVRDLLYHGKKTNGLLTEKVEDYILKNKLYRGE